MQGAGRLSEGDACVLCLDGEAGLRYKRESGINILDWSVLLLLRHRTHRHHLVEELNSLMVSRDSVRGEHTPRQRHRGRAAWWNTASYFTAASGQRSGQCSLTVTYIVTPGTCAA